MSNSSNSRFSGADREDGSSMAQSRIYEEEEESKQYSAYNDEREDDEPASHGEGQSEDISTDSDEDDEDEDILIKPKDLIVSSTEIELKTNHQLRLYSSNPRWIRESGYVLAAKVIWLTLEMMN